MDHPQLTARQSAALFVLMAESDEISTPRLRELGSDLDKPTRMTLLRHGLIESRKGDRNALYHSLTDRGWAWCASELRAAPPAKATPPYRALYAVLAGLGRYLDDTDTALFEVFGRPRAAQTTHLPATAAPSAETASAVQAPAPQAPATTPTAPTPVETRIDHAYRALAPRPGALVGVRALRAELADVDHDEFDAAIIGLQELPGVSLIPQEDQALLTEADWSNAVVVGIRPCHLFAIEEA